MRLLRTAAALALVLALAVAVQAADKGAKQAAKKGHATHGVVTAKEANSFTVEIRHKAKAGGVEKTTQKTFTVTKETTFEAVSGKKDSRTTEKVTFEALTQGDHVAVHHKPKSDVAEKVTIRHKKK